MEYVVNLNDVFSEVCFTKARKCFGNDFSDFLHEDLVKSGIDHIYQPNGSQSPPDFADLCGINADAKSTKNGLLFAVNADIPKENDLVIFNAGGNHIFVSWSKLLFTPKERIHYNKLRQYLKEKNKYLNKIRQQTGITTPDLRFTPTKFPRLAVGYGRLTKKRLLDFWETADQLTREELKLYDL
jgi:hypothetical protein